RWGCRSSTRSIRSRPTRTMNSGTGEPRVMQSRRIRSVSSATLPFSTSATVRSGPSVTRKPYRLLQLGRRSTQTPLQLGPPARVKSDLLVGPDHDIPEAAHSLVGPTQRSQPLLHPGTWGQPFLD